jgi:hypothetical protein
MRVYYIIITDFLDYIVMRLIIDEVWIRNWIF